MKMRAWAMIALMAAGVFGAWAGVTIHRDTSDPSRALKLADRLLDAPAAEVPYLLEYLRPSRDLALRRLREHWANSGLTEVARLHAACALADLDADARQYLVVVIPTAPDSECRNIVAALAASKSSVAPAVARMCQAASEPTSQARYAIVALHLGDPQPAQRLLAMQKDPLERTSFIHAFSQWHADPRDVANLLPACEDEAFRSGLAAALGTLDAGEIGRVIQPLSDLYLHAKEGSIHSAAAWALRQGGARLPRLTPESRPSAGRRWFHNGQGMTMIGVSLGKFQMGTPGEAPYDDETPAHEVTLNREYYMADREITVEQFLRFLNDADYPAAEKPRLWKEETLELNLLTDHPLEMVSWFDAVLYCNWLSIREGRRASYQRMGQTKIADYSGREALQDVWRCDFAADGYRLPTEAEWEYAARAGSSGAYCFGEGTTRLRDYAWFVDNSNAHAWPGGLKMPNALGLFDLHGNVWEWCWDWEAAYSAAAASDPAGPELGQSRVLRGGAAGGGALACRSAFRFGHRPSYRGTSHGFRVCCGP